VAEGINTAPFGALALEILQATGSICFFRGCRQTSWVSKGARPERLRSFVRSLPCEPDLSESVVARAGYWSAASKRAVFLMGPPRPRLHRSGADRGVGWTFWLEEKRVCVMPNCKSAEKRAMKKHSYRIGYESNAPQIAHLWPSIGNRVNADQLQQQNSVLRSTSDKNDSAPPAVATSVAASAIDYFDEDRRVAPAPPTSPSLCRPQAIGQTEAPGATPLSELGTCLCQVMHST